MARELRLPPDVPPWFRYNNAPSLAVLHATSSYYGVPYSQIREINRKGYRPGEIVTSINIASRSGRPVGTILGERSKGKRWEDIARDNRTSFDIIKAPRERGKSVRFNAPLNEPGMKVRGFEKNDKEFKGKGNAYGRNEFPGQQKGLGQNKPDGFKEQPTGPGNKPGKPGMQKSENITGKSRLLDLDTGSGQKPKPSGQGNTMGGNKPPKQDAGQGQGQGFQGQNNTSGKNKPPKQNADQSQKPNSMGRGSFFDRSNLVDQENKSEPSNTNSRNKPPKQDNRQTQGQGFQGQDNQYEKNNPPGQLGNPGEKQRFKGQQMGSGQGPQGQRNSFGGDTSRRRPSRF